MEPLVYFIVTMISLTLIHSMIYNSRRLETIGYALSIAFLQQLITGDEDIFLICSQFPLYVSPKDKDPNPDTTMPDAEARGVYVDHALLLPRAQSHGNAKLSQAFHQAHRQNHETFWRLLHISSLEVPLLEEKKRAPTRHPCDLDDYVWSIMTALNSAQSQVTTQAKILFSSPRFATQNLVILVASSGEFYRLGVLSRGHRVLAAVPTTRDVVGLLGPLGEKRDRDEVAKALVAELVVSARSPAQQEEQRLKAMKKAEDEETVEQNKARDARALVRQQRKDQADNMDDLERKLSDIVEDAGDPKPNCPYSDDWLEAYYKIYTQPHSNRSLQSQRCPTFFEPKPSHLETVTTLANLRDPADNRKVIFTGVIRLGSPTSDMFLQIIHQHLSSLARMERSRRQ